MKRFISISLIAAFLFQDIAAANPDCLQVRSMFSDPFLRSELYIEHEFQKLWACGIDASKRDKDLVLLPQNTGKRVIIKFKDKTASGQDVSVPVFVYDTKDISANSPLRRYEAIIGASGDVDLKQSAPSVKADKPQGKGGTAGQTFGKKNLVMQARMPKVLLGELGPLDQAVFDAGILPLTPWEPRRGIPLGMRFYQPSVSPGGNRIVFSKSPVTVFTPDGQDFKDIVRLNEEEADSIIAYVKNGGSFVFSSAMDKEWFYNKFLQPLSDRAALRGEKDICRSVYFILLDGREVFAFHEKAKAFYRVYGAEHGRKEEALRYVRRLISSRSRLIREKAPVSELKPFIWTFDKGEKAYVAEGRSVIVNVGTREFGAPGFVWAGVRDKDGAWDFGNIYMVPLVMTEDGNHSARLPEGCNAFTFFWTGADEAKTGVKPGHWEKTDVRIEYVPIKDEEFAAYKETGGTLPEATITLAGESQKVFGLPEKGPAGQYPDMSSLPGTGSRAQDPLQRIFYDKVKYVFDSLLVKADEVAVMKRADENELAKVLWAEKQDGAVYVSLYDSKNTSGTLMAVTGKTDIRKSVALALRLLGLSQAPDMGAIEAKICWSGGIGSICPAGAGAMKAMLENCGVRVSDYRGVDGNIAFMLNNGKIYDIKMPPADVEFSMDGPAVNQWQCELKEGYYYGKKIPNPECPEHFLPIIEHVLRTNYRGFVEKAFDRIFGMKVGMGDIDKVRIQYLRSGGLKYAFLAHVRLKSGVTKQFSIRASYPGMNSDDRINMINSNSQWSRFGHAQSKYAVKHGAEQTICFKDMYQVLDSHIIAQEYVEGKTLKDILIDNNIPFPVKTGVVKHAVTSYIEAFEKASISVFDPKPDNIVLEKDTENSWKIIDLDKIVSGDENSQSAIRTLEEYVKYLRQYYYDYLEFNIKAVEGRDSIVADDTMEQGRPVMDGGHGQDDTVISGDGARRLETRQEHDVFHANIASEINKAIVPGLEYLYNIDFNDRKYQYAHRGAVHYDIRKAVKDILARNPGNMNKKIRIGDDIVLRLEEKNGVEMLVIIDPAFNVNHAGRDALTVYARGESKAVHELTELSTWIDFALDPSKYRGMAENIPREPIAVKGHLENHMLGSRITRWINRMGPDGTKPNIGAAGFLKEKFHESACIEEFRAYLRGQVKAGKYTPETSARIFNRFTQNGKNYDGVEFMMGAGLGVELIPDGMNSSYVTLSPSGKNVMLTEGCLKRSTSDWIPFRVNTYVRYLWAVHRDGMSVRERLAAEFLAEYHTLRHIQAEGDRISLSQARYLDRFGKVILSHLDDADTISEMVFAEVKRNFEPSYFGARSIDAITVRQVYGLAVGELYGRLVKYFQELMKSGPDVRADEVEYDAVINGGDGVWGGGEQTELSQNRQDIYPDLTDEIRQDKKAILDSYMSDPGKDFMGPIKTFGAGRILNRDADPYLEDGYIYGHIACLKAAHHWGQEAMTPDIERSIFYSVYEAVANAYKHGGVGSTVTIRLKENNTLEVMCEDIKTSGGFADPEKMRQVGAEIRGRGGKTNVGIDLMCRYVPELVIESYYRRWEKLPDGTLKDVSASDKGDGTKVTMRWPGKADMDEVRIETARPDDINAISKIWEEDVVPGLEWWYRIMSRNNAMERMAKAIVNGDYDAVGRVFVARQGGEVAGFVMASVSQLSGRGVISVIAVRMSGRGHGLGTQLFDKALAWLKSVPGVGEIECTDISSDGQSGRMAARYGFRYESGNTYVLHLNDDGSAAGWINGFGPAPMLMAVPAIYWFLKFRDYFNSRVRPWLKENFALLFAPEAQLAGTPVTVPSTAFSQGVPADEKYQEPLFSDIRVRALMVGGSIWHGTNSATDLGEKMFGLRGEAQGLKTMMETKSGYAALHMDAEDYYVNIMAAYGEIQKVWKGARKYIEKNMLPSAGVAAVWKRKMRRVYVLLKASVDLRDKIIRGLSEEDSAMLADTQGILPECLEILGDRLMLLDSKTAGGEVDLSDMVKNVRSYVWSTRGARKDNGVLKPFCPDRAVMVRGNRRSIISAITNIVDNCIKYTMRDKAFRARVKVTLSVQGGNAVITISDNGLGMPLDMLEKMKKPFFTTQGTGVGLTEARVVALDHGGSLEIASKLGKGSVFTIRLPLSKSDISQQKWARKKRPADRRGYSPLLQILLDTIMKWFFPAKAQPDKHKLIGDVLSAPKTDAETIAVRLLVEMKMRGVTARDIALVIAETMLKEPKKESFMWDVAWRLGKEFVWEETVLARLRSRYPDLISMTEAVNIPVLLVDDGNNEIRDYERILAGLGFSVTLARDGDEALKMLLDGKVKPYAVLTDLGMKRMQGDELAKEIRANGLSVPVVVHTGGKERGTKVVLSEKESIVIRGKRTAGGIEEICRILSERNNFDEPGGLNQSQAGPKVTEISADLSAAEIEQKMAKDGFPEMRLLWKKYKKLRVPLESIDEKKLDVLRKKHIGTLVSHPVIMIAATAVMAVIGYFNLFLLMVSMEFITNGPMGMRSIYRMHQSQPVIQAISAVCMTVLFWYGAVMIQRYIIHPMWKIMPLELAAMLKKRYFRSDFEATEKARQVVRTLSSLGVNELWDNPSYKVEYRVAEGRIDRTEELTYSQVVQNILRDEFLGYFDEARKKHVPGQYFASLNGKRKAVTAFLKRYKDKIGLNKQGKLSLSECIEMLNVLLEEYVIPTEPGYERLVEHIRMLKEPEKVPAGIVRAGIWDRDPWKDLTHQTEFYSSASLRGVKLVGIGPKCRLGPFNYLLNKSVSTLYFTTKEGRIVRARLGAATIKDINGNDMPILFVDAVEGSIVLKPKVIKQAIEDYAKACGFKQVVYNAFPINKVPQRFASYLKNEGLLLEKIRIKYIDASERQYLDAFEFLLEPFEYKFPEGTIMGYAVPVNPCPERPVVLPNYMNKVNQYLKDNVLNIMALSASVWGGWSIYQFSPLAVIPYAVFMGAIYTIQTLYHRKPLLIKKSAKKSAIGPAPMLMTIPAIYWFRKLWEYFHDIINRRLEAYAERKDKVLSAVSDRKTGGSSEEGGARLDLTPRLPDISRLGSYYEVATREKPGFWMFLYRCILTNYNAARAGYKNRGELKKVDALFEDKEFCRAVINFHIDLLKREISAAREAAVSLISVGHYDGAGNRRTYPNFSLRWSIEELGRAVYAMTSRSPKELIFGIETLNFIKARNLKDWIRHVEDMAESVTTEIPAEAQEVESPAQDMGIGPFPMLMAVPAMYWLAKLWQYFNEHIRPWLVVNAPRVFAPEVQLAGAPVLLPVAALNQGRPGGERPGLRTEPSVEAESLKGTSDEGLIALIQEGLGQEGRNNVDVYLSVLKARGWNHCFVMLDGAGKYVRGTDSDDFVDLTGVAMIYGRDKAQTVTDPDRFRTASGRISEVLRKNIAGFERDRSRLDDFVLHSLMNAMQHVRKGPCLYLLRPETATGGDGAGTVKGFRVIAMDHGGGLKDDKFSYGMPPRDLPVSDVMADRPSSHGHGGGFGIGFKNSIGRAHIVRIVTNGETAIYKKDTPAVWFSKRVEVFRGSLARRVDGLILDAVFYDTDPQGDYWASAVRSEEKRALPMDKPAGMGKTVQTRKTIIKSLVGDLRNGENVAQLLKIALESYALNGKKVVMAFENGLGLEGSNLAGFMSAIEKWKKEMVKDYPKMEGLLNNIIVLKPFAAPGELAAGLKAKGVDLNDRENNLVFVFARHSAENVKAIGSIGQALRPSYIKEEDGKSFTGFYYPLIEIAALAMMSELLGADLAGTVETMRQEQKGFPIDSVTFENASYLIFTITPKIEPYAPDEHIKRFAKFLNFLRSA